MKHPTKSSIAGSLARSDYPGAELRIARQNMERCLAAYDEQGEEGLQRELDQMYPGTKPSPAPQFKRVPLGVLRDSYALVVPGVNVPTIPLAAWRSGRANQERSEKVDGYDPEGV
jgi:hypothetical protein